MASTGGAQHGGDPEDDGERIVLWPEERLACVLEVIRSARERLILSLFRCSEPQVLEELAEALARGVRVEVLLTPRAKRWKQRLQELWERLEGMGAQVLRYADPVVKYHAKYIVADDGPALVGSPNFTRKCFLRTCDFVQISRDPGVVAGLKRVFELDCGRSEAGLPLDLSERLIVGPERARAQLAALLGGAERSIRIIDTKVTDTEMVELLRARKRAGIEVEVLARRKLGALRSHGKLLLVDERVAVIGSIALSTLGLESRRELALIVAEPRCVEQLTAFYASLAADSSLEPASPGASI